MLIKKQHFMETFILYLEPLHETIQNILSLLVMNEQLRKDNLPLKDILQYRMEENYKISKEQHGDDFDVTLEEMKEFSKMEIILLMSS